MNRFVTWIRSIGLWLFEPKVAWTGVIILISALLFALRPGSSEFEVRVTGLILQAFGLGTVAFGIRKTRIFFGHQNVPQLFFEWVSRFPHWRRHAVIGAGSGMLSAATMSARGYVWSNVDPTAPIEAQIDALTKNLDRMNERINHLENDVDLRLREHSAALKQEQVAREKNDKQLHERLETAETSGLHISLIGLIWILFGLLLSTVSMEIFKVLNA